MIITHETTIEEYEAWLATNPRLSELQKATNKVFKIMFSAMRSISKLIKKIEKSRSCIAVAYTVQTLAYNKNGNHLPQSFEDWRESIAIELSKTTAHIKRLKLFDAIEGMAWAKEAFEQRHERIARIEEELAMEELHKSALEILVKK